MAKKKEDALSYLQLPLPAARKYSKMTKRAWVGLNRRQTVDTGALSMESNISTLEAPYLVPSESKNRYKGGYDNPIGVFGFDDFLLVIYRNGDDIKIDYITGDADVYTGYLQEGDATENDEYPRCVVQFNVYDTPTDPVTGEYTKKLLIFPDKKSMDFIITEDDFEISSLDVEVKEYENSEKPYYPPDTASHNYYYKNTSAKAKEADTLYGSAIYKWVDDESDSSASGWLFSMPPSFPPIEYAAVHLSRLFGVGGGRIYASGFNNYANWNLDTIDEYNESNAWCSPAQSNTKADGNFTGITVFDGHVICFKREFMHEIYNTKNPFRVVDIYADGTIDHRTVQDVGGRLIFASDNEIKVYTGSAPRVIGYYLNLNRLFYAVSGTDGRCYYLYCEDYEGNSHLFVYDTFVEQWAQQRVDDRVIAFAHNKNGMYMLLDDGVVYKMDTGEYEHEWSFETDLITAETVDIKHIKKLQLLADVAEGAHIDVYMLYGDEKFDATTSHLLYSSDGSGQKTIRVKPRRTANYGFKLHFEGYGYVKLYEMEISVESGGDLYVS